MRAPVVIIAFAAAFASDGGVWTPQAAADAGAPHSKEDVCRLVVLAARKELVVPPHHTNLLAQPATSELAGEHGRIVMDVGVREHGHSRYPLARGETCGDHELVELCDWDRLGNRCSRDRKDRERWRVVVELTFIDEDHVDSTAFLAKPPHVHRRTVEATMSPLPTFFGHFERRDGAWHEAPEAGAR